MQSRTPSFTKIPEKPDVPHLYKEPSHTNVSPAMTSLSVSHMQNSIHYFILTPCH